MREDLGDMEIDKRNEEIELLENNIIVWQNELDNLNITSVFNDTAGQFLDVEPEWRNYTDFDKKKEVVNFYIKDILCERGKVEIIYYDNSKEIYSYNIHKKLFEKILE